ncbi:hypothetical protein BDP67DRAFT_146516 [Colletotrichum lupini]|nr:hypothetical protein BDP67DRAFT_146516 [Colletotrichum lupini]
MPTRKRLFPHRQPQLRRGRRIPYSPGRQYLASPIPGPSHFGICAPLLSEIRVKPTLPIRITRIRKTDRVFPFIIRVLFIILCWFRYVLAPSNLTLPIFNVSHLRNSVSAVTLYYHPKTRPHLEQQPHYFSAPNDLPLPRHLIRFCFETCSLPSIHQSLPSLLTAPTVDESMLMPLKHGRLKSAIRSPRAVQKRIVDDSGREIGVRCHHRRLLPWKPRPPRNASDQEDTKAPSAASPLRKESCIPNYFAHDASPPGLIEPHLKPPINNTRKRGTIYCTRKMT